MSKKGIIIVLAVIAAFMLAVALITAANADKQPFYSCNVKSDENWSEAEPTKDMDLIEVQWKTNQYIEKKRQKKCVVTGQPVAKEYNSGKDGNTD